MNGNSINVVFTLDFGEGRRATVSGRLAPAKLTQMSDWLDQSGAGALASPWPACREPPGVSGRPAAGRSGNVHPCRHSARGRVLVDRPPGRQRRRGHRGGCLVDSGRAWAGRQRSAARPQRRRMRVAGRSRPATATSRVRRWTRGDFAPGAGPVEAPHRDGHSGGGHACWRIRRGDGDAGQATVGARRSRAGAGLRADPGPGDSGGGTSARLDH
jgi:hypothetical protein